MGKYLRLLRLQDQYLQLGCALAAGVYLHFKTGYFWWWAIAVTLISFSTFITNEMVDREDVDKYSWNKVHLRKSDRLDKQQYVSYMKPLSWLLVPYIIWWLGR